MWSGSISLQGNLFIQAFKSFVDGDPNSAAKIIPLLTLEFPQLELVLRHDNKQQLLDFFQFLKRNADKLQQQPQRFRGIEEVLYKIRQSIQPQKEGYQQFLAKGKKLLSEKKSGQALANFRLALNQKETQEVLVYFATIQMSHYQDFEQFTSSLEKAMRYQRDQQVLSAYEGLISEMQDQSNIDLHLRFKVIHRAISLQSKNPNVYLELALVGLKLHMKLGEYLEIVEANCPDSIEKPFAIGLIKFSEKYYGLAEELFQACEKKIKINYKNRELRKNGDDSLFLKISNFNKADQLYYFLGKVNEKLKADKQAEMYEKGLKYNPRNIDVWKQLIRLMQRQPGREAELFCIIQHINIFSQYVCSIRDFSINETIIELLFQSGEKEALIEYALGLVASFPDIDQTYYLVAKVYYKVGEYQKCKEYCQKCLQINGKNQGVYFFLGKIAFDQQQISDAREYYNKAIQLNPKQYLAHFNLGILEYKSCKYQEAAKSLELAIGYSPDFSPAYELLIHSYMKQGKFQEARDIVVELPQRENQSYLMDFFYAKISYQQENDKEAEKHFKLVLAKQPDHWDSIYKLVVINISHNGRKESSVLPEARWSEAGAYVERLLAASVVKGRYKAAKGYLLIKENKYQEAIPMLMQAISQHKSQFQAYFHLGFALKDRITDIDNLCQQIQQLQELIKTTQTNIQSFYFSSLFYLGFKAYDYFLQKFNKYIKSPKASQSQSIRQSIRIYRNVIAHLQHLRRFYPDDNDLIILLGIFYRDVANREKTLRYFRKLLGKLQVKSQATHLLFQKCLRFYNQNSKYQQNSNYLQYIFEFIFQQVLQTDQMQGMMLYNYLRDGEDYFNSNQGISFAIQERKRDILSMNVMHVNGRQIDQLDSQWRKEIVEKNHFLKGTEMMEVAKKTEKQKYYRCLVYQFYCNKIYPYIYHDQQSVKSLELCLEFLINPKQPPNETLEQLCQLTRSKINPILITKAEGSQKPHFSENYKKYESQIFFCEFDTDELAPFTFDCKNFQLSFKRWRINPNPQSSIEPQQFQFKYLNSLQKKIIKKPPQVQSLIMIAKSSIIAHPKARTSILTGILTDQQQDFQPFD